MASKVCKITWSKDDPLGMASIGEFAVTKMTGNTTFPTPPVAMGPLGTACALVRTLYPTRLGDATERLAFTNAVDDLDAKLHSEVVYVNSASGGDEVKIISAGFTAIAGTKTPAIITGPVEVIKLKPIGGGKLKVLAIKPLGGKSLLHVIYTGVVVPLILRGNQLIIPDGSSGIQIVPTGKKSLTLEGFSDFPKVTVVTYSINAAGISPASGEFSTKIL